MTIDATDKKLISSYSDLETYLRSLPQPLAGYKRVYRGQTKNHPQIRPTGMRPAGMRGQIARGVLWRTYSRLLVQDLAIQNPEGMEEFNLWLFWLDAIAQHYGPGSKFLDVTHSLDIALWFALHNAIDLDATSVIGPKGSLNQEQDLVTHQTWCKYEPRREGDAWLYVFDAPVFKDTGTIENGTLIDLLDAPPAFSQSARIRAQKACLLIARQDHNHGDLKGKLACPPIRLAAGGITFAARDLSTEEIFPRPSSDPWYARLLSIPVTPQFAADSGEYSFSQPLDVRPYWPESDKSIVNEVRALHISLAPPIFAIAAIDKSKVQGGTHVNWDLISHTPPLEDAPVVVIEGQLIFTTPPVDSGMWNEGLLAEDVAEEVKIFNSKTSDVSDSITLDNVLFEFSPLEYAGWERVEHNGNQIQILRAVWYVRKGTRIVLTYFYQVLPSGEEFSLAAEFAFDCLRQRFQLTPFGKLDWKDVSKMPLLAKAFFVVRLLLRDLSPNVKVTPYPIISLGVIEKEQKSNKAILYKMREACMLVRAKNNPNLYFVRELNLHDPYIGPGGLSMQHASIEIGHIGQFCDVDPNYVRSRVAADSG